VDPSEIRFHSSKSSTGSGILDSIPSLTTQELPIMNRAHSLFVLGLSLLLALMGPGCQRLGGKSFRDTVTLNNEKPQKALPHQAPKTVYVADFTLEIQNFQGDQGVRGALPGLLNSAATEPVGSRLPQPLKTSDPDAKAREIVQIMAESLMSDLKGQGLRAQRLPTTELPRDGWLISGQFTEVDEGNRLRRAALGFGQGASQMEVHVGISDLSSANPTQPFVEFGTVKQHGEKPGAAVTMNPYAAAAKFVMEKNASEKDTRKTAATIVEELLKYRAQAQAAAR
jgi:hypothetical protein